MKKKILYLVITVLMLSQSSYAYEYPRYTLNITQPIIAPHEKLEVIPQGIGQYTPLNYTCHVQSDTENKTIIWAISWGYVSRMELKTLSKGDNELRFGIYAYFEGSKLIITNFEDHGNVLVTSCYADWAPTGADI